MHPFTHLATDVRDRLYRLALRVTGDTGQAEDVVQDVLLTGWKQREEIVELENPPAWLLRMTRHRAIDLLRSRTARSRRELAVAPADRDARTPLRLAEGADTLAHVHRIIGSLPERQRSVLQLREVEGMSYREIGAATDLSPEQVKVYLHRARTRIRQLLVDQKIMDR